MQIVAVADVHGNGEALQKVLDAENATHIFCLGDGVREYETAAQNAPDRVFHIVSGNCDWAGDYPTVGLDILGGKRILFLHGHTNFVKRSLEPALALSRHNKADLLLFGHTHRFFTQQDGAVLACNPGSLGFDGTYAVLSWNGEHGDITVEKKEV